MTAQPISKIALICAGGTGGHIFPGIAVAKGLQSKGWQVEWLGTSGEAVRPSMESQLVPQQGFRFHGLPFGGLRGQGVWAKLMLPWRLFLAGRQAWKVILAVNPGVVLGFGGYPSVPGCLAARLSGKPTVIHGKTPCLGWPTASWPGGQPQCSRPFLTRSKALSGLGILCAQHS
jgi:UDP-N-acetylglucosamine--N-acetylmuramyl-(pentapeptide) pyrophosphoryl-undecaprenol N-acetylglucosamine transferase